MRKNLALLFALPVWFAVVTQFILMLENRVAPIPETIVRFLSFFTILTNIMVALFFTGQVLNVRSTSQPGSLTAVTVYIFIVGMVYQVLLRHIWQPKGLQLIVDELLHTIIPLLVILYWFIYEEKLLVRYSQFKTWLIYPLVYLVFIIIRGSFSDFYPYPFVNVAKIGLAQVLINSSFLTIFFILTSYLFIAVVKKSARKRPSTA